MKKYFTLILENRLWILLAFGLLLLWTVLGINDLNISAVPDISNQQVVVNTKTGAFSPEQIEKIVTFPIEFEMSGLPKVKEVRSLSKYGLSQVIVIFEDDTDIYFARQVVTEKLQIVAGDLPVGLNPQLTPVTTGLGEIFMWTLSLKPGERKDKLNEKEQLQYLRRIQDYTIRPRVKQVAGVAEVDTNGGYNTEIHINYFPDKLKNFGLNTSDVIIALKSIGVSYGGGYIKKQGEQITIRSVTPADNIEDIESYTLKIMPSGKKITIGDVCSVKYESSLRVGAATSAGEETVLGTILMRTGSNSRKVVTEAQKVLDTLKLPEDVQLDIVYNRKFLVDKTISTVEKNLVEGALLVIVVLLLILGNFRAALLVSMVIPVSMIIAFRGMKIFDISANLMSLGAIDFGLLVDASVVFVENFLSKLAKQQGEIKAQQKMALIIDSFQEVARPVIFGLAIIMLVYVPILALEGVEGKMFHPMAKTVLMALSISLIVALLVVPVLIYYFLKTEGGEHKEPFIFSFIQKSYQPALSWALDHRKTSVGLSLAVFAASMILFLNIGSDFVPQLDEGDIVIGLVRDSKQNIDESVRWQKQAEKLIATFPEVETVFSRLGTPESATDPMSPNFADTFVILKKNKNDWPLINGKRRSKDELFTAIADKLKKELPEQAISATQPIEMRFNEILEGSRADITMRIIGPDLDKLIEYAEKGENILKDINGVQAIEFDALTGLTKSRVLDIEINPKAVSLYGLDSEIVNQQMEYAMAGLEVGYYFIDNIKTPVIFHLDEGLRNDLETLKALPVSHPEGGEVPLGKLTDFKFRDKVTTIARLWAERYSAISIYIAGRDISSFVAEAKDKIAQQLDLGPDYRIQWGGQFKNLERARKRLAIIIPITMIIIFLIILKMTNSLVQSLIIFSSIPLGAAGGVFLLFIRQMNFSVSAAVGFIALSGIVVLNSLVLVNYINQLIDEGMNVSRAIREGASSRLRPVAMTALVASLGFFPMAFNTGMGSEVQRPLATVVIGGLVTSTLLTMLIIPSLMSLVMQKQKDSGGNQ